MKNLLLPERERGRHRKQEYAAQVTSPTSTIEKTGKPFKAVIFVKHAGVLSQFPTTYTLSWFRRHIGGKPEIAVNE